MDRDRVRHAIGGAIVAVLVLLAPTASSHPAANHYNRKWVASHHTGTHITWRFSPGFPSGNKKERVVEAFAQWNNVGQPMDFTKLSDATSSYVYDCSQDHSYHGVFFNPVGDGGGGTVADTLKCWHPDNFTLHNFSIRIDQDETWYDNASNGPNNQHDIGGAATHEVGHATGWAFHHGSGSTECSSTPTHTMCGYAAVVPFSFRSLETHDSHTFDNAY